MTIKTFRPSAARVVRAALSVGAVALVALAVLIAQSIALTPEAQAQETCPAWMRSVSGNCEFCPGNQIVKDGSCQVAGSNQELCTGKGWDFVGGNFPSCVINHAPGINGRNQQRCTLFPQNDCAARFGANHFPNRPEDGSKPIYAYNCDVSDQTGLIPAIGNTISATECLCPDPDEQGLGDDGRCAACPTNFDTMIFNRRCVPENEEDIGKASEKVLCGAFGGAVEDATGGGRVCSGMDANDTFCVIDSTEGFPCRGLLKHLYTCNVQHNRKALNPFFCGAKCGEQQAVGSDCIEIRRGGN